MQRLNLLLLLLLLVCAVLLVTSEHWTRRAFTELSRAQEHERKLEADFRRLQLEASATAIRKRALELSIEYFLKPNASSIETRKSIRKENRKHDNQ